MKRKLPVNIQGWYSYRESRVLLGGSGLRVVLRLLLKLALLVGEAVCYGSLILYCSNDIKSAKKIVAVVF